MTGKFARFVAAAALAGMLSAPAAAQLEGNTVYPAFTGTGVTIQGDYALSLNDDAKLGDQSTGFAGGRILLGLPMFSVWAGGGAYPLGVDGADSKFGFGGGAGFHVLNAPMTPVAISIQAGAGYLSSEGSSLLNIPFGALVEINVPTSGVGVKPWIYPYGKWSSLSPDAGDSQSEFGFGASGGLLVTLPMGLGFQGALDWHSINAFGADVKVKPLVASFGLHYKITVPSLGM